MLHTIDIASPQPTRALMVMLHGIGADAMDLLPLGEFFQKHFPSLHILSVEAPFDCDYGFGKQWFSLERRESAIMLPELNQSSAMLADTIKDKMMALGLDENRLIMLGFSQGTMTGLHYCLHHSPVPAVMIGFSGGLMDEYPLLEEAQSDTAFVLIHGEEDDIVPAQLSIQSAERLQALGYHCEHALLPDIAHTISDEGLAIASEVIALLYEMIDEL